MIVIQVDLNGQINTLEVRAAGHGVANHETLQVGPQGFIATCQDLEDKRRYVDSVAGDQNQKERREREELPDPPYDSPVM